MTKLLKSKGIGLIVIPYNDKVNKKYLIEKLDDYLGESKCSLLLRE